jgi:bifunctional UDP-N-acetylglucosamine pyrophosphorylase/glucosamine-1-phosphate N-acetyltransferase
MLAYVFDACRAAGIQNIICVVGHGKDRVMDTFAADRDITWVEQREQLGTGHAVMVCRDAFAQRFDEVIVLGGDGPLIRAETLSILLAKHREENAAVTLATAILEDPTGYGRIVRGERGQMSAIVEHRDCTPEQRAVREVNPSYYCYRTADLVEALADLKPNNAKGEYYITDTIGWLVERGRKAIAVESVPPEDILSINNRRELADVNAAMRGRILRGLMESGVTIVDPASTWIDSRASLGVDTIVHPFTVIDGPAKIGAGCTIGPFVHLHDERIDEQETVRGEIALKRSKGGRR